MSLLPEQPDHLLVSDRIDTQTLRSAEPRRICILKPSALGDVVQSLPVLTGLRARWPQAAITWVIAENLSELVDGHPLLDDWLPFQRNGGPRAFGRLLRQIRSRRFDLVIDLQGLLRTGLMTLASGALLRVGLETAREGASLAYHFTLPRTDRGVPAHARYIRLVEVLGKAKPVRRSLARPSTSHGWLTEHDGRTGSPRPVPVRPAAGGGTRPLLAVHPGARWESKQWPVGRFAAVAARAARELGASIVVVGDASQPAVSRGLIDDIRAVVPAAGVYNLAGRTTISGLADVLRQSNLLLSNDSGPMHLAAAIGTPVVGLFTSTRPLLSGPPTDAGPDGPQHHLLGTPTACAGCYRRRCPLSGELKNACQRDLTVDRVWQAVRDTLQRQGAQQQGRLATTTMPIGAIPQEEWEPVLPRSA